MAKLDYYVKNKMCELYKSGMTLAEIGGKYNRSREGIRLIISSMGVTKEQGGAKIKQAKHALEKKISYLKSWVSSMKCTKEEYFKLRQIENTPIKDRIQTKYTKQKNNARLRGIEFNLSFPEWVKIWNDSGRWNERGTGHGYVMARYKDVGAYEVGNVEIIPAIQNNRDAHKYKKWDCGGHGKGQRKKMSSLYCKRGHYKTSKTVDTEGCCRICRNNLRNIRRARKKSIDKSM